jgi:hypothetical protein
MHSVTRLDDVTHYNRPMNDLYKFDTVTTTWSHVASSQVDSDLPPARSFHKMTAVGTTLYIFGGCASVGRLSDLHSYVRAVLAFRQNITARSPTRAIAFRTFAPVEARACVLCNGIPLV